MEAGPAAANYGSWLPSVREVHPLEIFLANGKWMQPREKVHQPEAVDNITGYL